MKVFLDTNLLIDIGQKRAGAATASEVISRCVLAGNSGVISWHTIANTFYLMRHYFHSASEASRFVDDLLRWADVATVGKSDAVRALSLGYNDFEDALQMASAEACAASWIVSRNKTDFKGGTVPVLTPEEFLSRFP